MQCGLSVTAELRVYNLLSRITVYCIKNGHLIVIVMFSGI